MGVNPSVIAFVETNLFSRHLTGDSPDGGAGDGLFRSRGGLLLTDFVAAKTLRVLESFYEGPATRTPRRSVRWSRPTRSCPSTLRRYFGRGGS